LTKYVLFKIVDSDHGHDIDIPNGFALVHNEYMVSVMEAQLREAEGIDA